MLPSVKRASLSIALVLAAAGCASVPSAAVQTASSDAPAYTLGPGDKLHIIVYNETELTGDYAIAPDGSVAFPLIGNVPASGRSPVELQNAITAMLAKGYILDPKVTVEVLNFRPFFILGEVNKPGQYPYIEQLTVAQAVATAGGFTYRANRGKVFIRRKGEAGEQAYNVKGGRSVPVFPGDTVRVGERYF